MKKFGCAVSHCACRVKRVSINKRSRDERTSNFESAIGSSQQVRKQILVNHGEGEVVDCASMVAWTSVRRGANSGGIRK